MDYLKDKYEHAIEKANEALARHDAQGALTMVEDMAFMGTTDYRVPFELGSIQLLQGNKAAAFFLFRAALTLKSNHTESMNNIGTIYKEWGLTDKARKMWEKCLKRTPADARLLHNLSSVTINNGTPDEALEYCARALEANPNHKQVLWNKGLAHLERGDWKQGWKLYEYGLIHGLRNNRKYQDDRVEFWNGSKGRNVVVYGEQGIGDELMFATVLPELCADSASVVFECHPRLERIFKLTFDNIPNLTIYPTRKDKSIPWLKYHKIDAKLPLGSLGYFYRSDGVEPRDGLLQLLPEKTTRPRIGISWLGGTLQTNKLDRSIPLDGFDKMVRAFPDVDWVSFQYTKGAREETDAFETRTGIRIHHNDQLVQCFDYCTTAQLAASCDVIVSVCNSLVHLAGFMGIPCVVLTPKQVAWRYGAKGEMPWYKSVRLIRQADPGKWEPALRRAQTVVASYLKNIESKTESSTKPERVTAVSTMGAST